MCSGATGGPYEIKRPALVRFIAASVAESVEYVRGNELGAFLQTTVPEGRPCAVLGLPPDPFSRLAICGGLARRLDALSMGCETGLCARRRAVEKRQRNRTQLSVDHITPARNFVSVERAYTELEQLSAE